MTPLSSAVARELCRYGASVHRRGLTHGRTGNLSARIAPDRLLVTPSGGSLEELEPGSLALLDLDGRHLDGPAPSKEAFLHAAVLRSRPQDAAVVHLHSPYAVAVSCLRDLRVEDPLPVLTPYFAMRIQRLVLVDYHPPGDRRLEPVAETLAIDSGALLIRRHGPVVSGHDIAAAGDAFEELEASAGLYLTLRELPYVELDESERARLSRPD